MEKTFPQSELEAKAAALGDTSEGLTGSEIGHLLATVKMAILRQPLRSGSDCMMHLSSVRTGARIGVPSMSLSDKL
jgi:hypothetical protein